MHCLSKHLLWNCLNKRKELNEVNEIILEEIIERSLKFRDNSFYKKSSEIVSLLIQTRKVQDVFDCI